MKIFVPLDDSMLDELAAGEIPVPFQAGLVSLSQVEAAGMLQDQSSFKTSSSPGLAPNSAALPEFSSSTYIAGPLLG